LNDESFSVKKFHLKKKKIVYNYCVGVSNTDKYHTTITSSIRSVNAIKTINNLKYIQFVNLVSTVKNRFSTFI